MKSGNQKILTKINNSSFFGKLFLFLFVFHLLVAHLAFQNYIICIEDKGNVHLESLEEQQFCCGINPEIYSENSSIEYSLAQEQEECKDIILSEYCAEEYPNATVRIIPQIVTSVLFINNDSLVSDSVNLLSINQFQLLNISHQLTSYKTVSLLI